jgi:hypothetical protein
MWNSSTNIAELRTLLEDLYPDVHIASSGVALLAAQIRNLEHASLVIESINPSTNVTMAPTIHWRSNYGANDYSK